MRLAAGVLVLAALLACLGASSARADDRARADLVTASVLFQHGKALLDKGRYAEACPKLEAAQRLVTGIGVTLYLGDCYEKTGRLARAWEQFDKARGLAEAKQDGRAAVARERAQRLWPQLAKVTLVVPPAADVAGLIVTEDGATVDRGGYNVERPTEPGTHRFRAIAPDRTPWETSVEIPATPASLRVEVPPLAEPGPAAAAVPPLGVPGLAAAASVPPSQRRLVASAPASPERSTRIPAQRVVGIAVFGVGVVGLTVGGIVGLQAKAQMDDSNASGHCQANDHCDASGLAERSSALTKATISTIALGAGLAGVGGGALLYLTAPDEPPGIALAARPTRGGGSVVLEGRW
jgi:hypothetical protein